MYFDFLEVKKEKGTEKQVKDTYHWEKVISLL